jgi:hypothetical protein
MIKYIAAILVVALLVVGVVASYFITSGMTVEVKSNVEVRIGVDHKPAPTIHYHIVKEGVWGV